MTARVDVQPKMLRWACERAGTGVDQVADKLPGLPKWLRGEAQPTFKQLEAFAKATRTPFGYLFLPAPPDEKLPLTDFRTLAGARAKRPSPDLLETVYAMKRRQAWLRETLLEDGTEPLAFVASARASDPPEAVAGEMRRMLGSRPSQPSFQTLRGSM